MKKTCPALEQITNIKEDSKNKSSYPISSKDVTPSQMTLTVIFP